MKSNNYCKQLFIHVFAHLRFKLFSFTASQNPVRAARSHDAVPIEDVQWLSQFMHDQTEPVSFEKAIHMLRRTHYPFHHDPLPWNPGTVNKLCN